MCLLMLSSDQSQGSAFLSQGSALFSQGRALLGRTDTGWFTTFEGREAGLVCGVPARFGLRGEAGKNLFLRVELLLATFGHNHATAMYCIAAEQIG
jgi:hypothetical protein